MTITDEPTNANLVPTPDNNLNDEKPIGFGRMLRKEDPRLVRGRGQFVDRLSDRNSRHGYRHDEILRNYQHRCQSTRQVDGLFLQ